MTVQIMRILSSLLLAALVGCAGRSAMPAIPQSSFRQSLSNTTAELLTRSVQSEGWQVEILERSKSGQTAVNNTEEWDQSTIWVVFAAKRAEESPVVLTPEQGKPVLANLKSDLRKMIQNNGGEVMETLENEAYRERLLIVTYRFDRVYGTATAKLGPASDRAEETHNRLELTIREQN